MGFDPVTIGIAGLILGGIGQGISYAGQQQAAETQATYARLNAQSGLVQATLQSRMATAHAAISSQQQLNARVAGLTQAEAIRDEARQKERESEVNLARQMAEHARINSMIRARQGSTGTTVGVGSQFDILMEAAELEALEISESKYQTEIQRRQLYRAAEGAEIGATESGIQAGLELMEGEARASAYRTQGVQAQLQGLAGVSAARGASLSALGGAIGGFGNLAFRAFDLSRLGAFRFS